MLGLKLMLTAGILWWVVWYIASDYRKRNPYIWDCNKGLTIPFVIAITLMGTITTIFAVVFVWGDIPC